MEPEHRVHFLANACHVCKSKNTRYTCEICRLIFYCSPEHRKEDWFHHSQMCWAVNKICRAENCDHLLESFKGDDFTDFKHEVVRRCLGLLERGLKPWEYEMIYYPRVCDVCHEFDWKKLEPCKGCEFVYTCEKKHFRKDHGKWCNVMKTYSEMAIERSRNENEDHSCRLNFQLDAQNGAFKSMADVLEHLQVDGEDKASFQFEIEKAHISELLTYPLTVLNSLRLVNLSNKRELTVLFIGAEVQAEVEPLAKWENYLLHNLAQVQVLNLIFLGPELVNTSEQFEDLCDACGKQGKELNYEFISGKLYHEYSGKKPDLICALNSGMYRDFGFKNENSWKSTIIKLFTQGTSPVLITEYTCHELKKNFEKIKNLCGDVTKVTQVEVNPFASLKPGLNIISKNEAPVIFKNYYYVILQSKNTT